MFEFRIGHFVVLVGANLNHRGKEGAILAPVRPSRVLLMAPGLFVLGEEVGPIDALRHTLTVSEIDGGAQTLPRSIVLHKKA